MEKNGIRAAIKAGEATAAMAADEVLVRAADVASADPLGINGVHDQGGCKMDPLNPTPNEEGRSMIDKRVVAVPPEAN